MYILYLYTVLSNAYQRDKVAHSNVFCFGDHLRQSYCQALVVPIFQNDVLSLNGISHNKREVRLIRSLLQPSFICFQSVS